MLRLAVPAIVIGLLLWAFGSGDIGTRLTRADPLWVGVALACLWGQTILMALRWRLVARCLGLRFGAGWAIREYLTGQVVNLTLPGGVLGDASRAVRSRDGTGWKPAAQAVVIERVAGQVGLLVVGLAGAVWGLAAPGAFDWPPGLLRGLIFAVLLGIGLAAGIFAAARRGRIADLLRRCLPTRRIAGAQVALSLGAALLNVAAFAACARATGTALGPQATLLLVPLILTAMLIPLSVAGWGWREGAAALLFPIAGATAQAGIAAGIVFGAAMMLSVLPVLIFWVWPVSERTG
ncbi:lysylphosphatidylglycerol synthase transmembrane domain-containing protein [Jannaschia donghaensis]|nr:lysylphosphatidylglycerol synthase transmembrane domain-containing protein [Jannaschia donghaensis]